MSELDYSLLKHLKDRLAETINGKVSKNANGDYIVEVLLDDFAKDCECKIKQLQDEVERIHKLGRERASDIADYRDEVKQLQDEIAELKNNPDDPWNGVLNEEGEL